MQSLRLHGPHQLEIICLQTDLIFDHFLIRKVENSTVFQWFQHLRGGNSNAKFDAGHFEVFARSETQNLTLLRADFHRQNHALPAISMPCMRLNVPRSMLYK